MMTVVSRRYATRISMLGRGVGVSSRYSAAWLVTVLMLWVPKSTLQNRRRASEAPPSWRMFRHVNPCLSRAWRRPSSRLSYNSYPNPLLPTFERSIVMLSSNSTRNVSSMLGRCRRHWCLLVLFLLLTVHPSCRSQPPPQSVSGPTRGA